MCELQHTNDSEIKSLCDHLLRNNYRKEVLHKWLYVYNLFSINIHFCLILPLPYYFITSLYAEIVYYNGTKIQIGFTIIKTIQK